MAGNFITNDMVAKEALMEFKNNLALANKVNRDYDDNFKAPNGDSIRVRKPTRFTVQDGATVSSFQQIYQQYETVTLNKRKHVAIEITEAERTLDLDSFNRNIVQPAMLQLANQVDADLAEAACLINSVVGTPGTPINSFDTINDANVKMNLMGIPQANRSLTTDPINSGSLQNSLKNFFNTSVNTEILRRGQLGELAGFMTFMDQNVRTQTVGDYGGTPLTNGAGQTGSTLVTDGWSTSVTGLLKKYDKFTIAGVYAVNPITRQSTGQLMQFTVTADVDSDGSGNASIPISPAINDGTVTATAPYQNVSISIPDGAAIVPVGVANSTYKQNIAMIPQALTLAVAPLSGPNGRGAYSKTMRDADAKVSIRMVQDYNINSDAELFRFDILYAVKCFPEYGCIVAG